MGRPRDGRTGPAPGTWQPPPRNRGSRGIVQYSCTLHGGYRVQPRRGSGCRLDIPVTRTLMTRAYSIRSLRMYIISPWGPGRVCTCVLYVLSRVLSVMRASRRFFLPDYDVVRPLTVACSGCGRRGHAERELDLRVRLYGVVEPFDRIWCAARSWAPRARPRRAAAAVSYSALLGNESDGVHAVSPLGHSHTFSPWQKRPKRDYALRPSELVSGHWGAAAATPPLLWNARSSFRSADTMMEPFIRHLAKSSACTRYRALARCRRARALAKTLCTV